MNAQALIFSWLLPLLVKKSNAGTFEVNIIKHFLGKAVQMTIGRTIK